MTTEAGASSDEGSRCIGEFSFRTIPRFGRYGGGEVWVDGKLLRKDEAWLPVDPQLRGQRYFETSAPKYFCEILR